MIRSDKTVKYFFNKKKIKIIKRSNCKAKYFNVKIHSKL